MWEVLILVLLVVVVIFTTPNECEEGFDYSVSVGNLVERYTISLPDKMENLRVEEFTDPRVKRALTGECKMCIQAEHNYRQVANEIDLYRRRSNIKSIEVDINERCEKCLSLKQAWTRYFKILDGVNHFIHTGNVPEHPPIPNEKCKQCIHIYSVYETFSRAILAQIHAIANGTEEYHKNVDIPNPVKPECEECENILEDWFVYTSTLLEILNIVKYNKVD